MTTTETNNDQYSLLTVEANVNPYEVYRKLRNESPVHFSSELYGWLVTNYQDVWTALQDQRFSLGGGVDKMFLSFPEEIQNELSLLRTHLSQWMGTLDPPEHTRLRGVMNKGFTPSLVEKMRPFIKQTAQELLAKGKAAGEMDLIEDFANPLPAIVIAAMLGVPQPDRHLFKKWSEVLTEFLGFGHFEIEVMRRAQETIVEMTDYLRHLLNNEEIPENDSAKTLLHYYMSAIKEKKFRDEEELLANLVLLLFAGHETTSILISNSLLLLMENEPQRELLVADESLMSSAVEEFLRFESPVQMVRRSAREDIEFQGVKIAAGDMVWLVIGSANRDAKNFAEPDSLDLTRKENRHLAFGSGIHYCLGASLSRAEGEETLKTALAEISNWNLKPEGIERIFNPTTRALKTFPVSWKN